MDRVFGSAAMQPGSHCLQLLGSQESLPRILDGFIEGVYVFFGKPVPGDSSRDLFGLVSSRDPFKG